MKVAVNIYNCSLSRILLFSTLGDKKYLLFKNIYFTKQQKKKKNCISMNIFFSFTEYSYAFIHHSFYLTKSRLAFGDDEYHPLLISRKDPVGI